ncbi:MAG: DEAD/DEAH box helicase [Pseudomonas sp.]
MSKLRPYQSDLAEAVKKEWASGHRGVLLQMATGGGKTVVLGHLAAEHRGVGVLIVHRQELVGQLSLQLAREGVYHDFVAPEAVRRDAVKTQMEELGRSFVQSGANWYVAGVDTLVRKTLDWAHRCTLAIVDEGHHVLRENKWGKSLSMFPSARFLLPTATPCRADGKGLGSHAHGAADVMVKAPSQRWLIDSGYLTPYRLILPESKLDMSSVPIGADGDFNTKAAAREADKAMLYGDAVGTYLKFARGRRAIAFCINVDAATEFAVQLRAAGVRAEMISGSTPGHIRRRVLLDLKRGELDVVTSVDVLGEGVDIPAVEVVLMLRPTQSFALYAQQFGRALRILEGKTEAIIIDHVGNIERHNGPPDWRTFWTLDAREQRNSGPSLIKRCPNPECARGYLRELGACPHCDGGVAKAAPTARALPEQVDGNMAEVDPDWIAAKAREIARINGDPVALPVDLAARAGAFAQHKRRRDAADAVRLAMDTWAACQGAVPLDVLNRRFYLKFGTDVMSAQTLSRPEAEDLRGRIEASIVADGFVINEVVQ